MTAFGLPRLLNLFLKSLQGGAADEAKMMQMQMGMVGAAGQPGMWQGKAQYKGELSALGIADWAPAHLVAAEKELLADAEALRSSRGAAAKKSQ